ncbi:MAG: glycosyltransferase [Acidobacteriia bacterium]|nr:glycosyltransferase [Terriglobia bacterium]
MSSNIVKFSLILATVGRVDELACFLHHLDQQTYRCFELIVVDQNRDPILDLLIKQYQGKFPLLHLKSEQGLSRARNTGLQHFTGDIAAFPDDDCWYPPDSLQEVARLFVENPAWDGLVGKAIDNIHPDAYRWFPNENGWINRTNVWRQALSITMFLRKSVVQGTGCFDETLGAGSGQGRLSAEETDYLIRSLESGFRIQYTPDVRIFHPSPHSTYDRNLIRKGYGYSVGFGYVLRKHKYPLPFVAYSWLRALGGALVSLVTLNFPKSRYHFTVLKGRILGWLG